MRAAWVWISISPGTTSLPRASMVSAAPAGMLAAIAAIRPWAMATSRIASSLREGSMTRPPLTIRSYFTVAAASTSTPRTNVAAPVAVQTNWRRFITFNSLQIGQSPIYSRKTSGKRKPGCTKAIATWVGSAEWRITSPPPGNRSAWFPPARLLVPHERRDDANHPAEEVGGRIPASHFRQPDYGYTGNDLPENSVAPR